jgi:hypothetical protein
MFLGKSEKVVHDNFIQAAHRIAGRYPAYFDPVTKKPSRTIPLKLWASSQIHAHITLTMKFHDVIIENAMEGRMPFADVGTFEWAGGTKPKLTKPQVQKALSVKLSDALLVRVKTGVSTEVAVALCQDHEALIALVHDLLADKGIRIDMSKLRIGSVIQSHTLDDADRVTIQDEISNKMTRKGQTIIARLCQLKESNKIHGVRNRDTYIARAVQRPRTKLKWENQYQSRAACWMSNGLLICSVFDEEVVREQAALWTEGLGEHYYQDSVFAMIYWFPDSLPNGNTCTLTLAVDMPRDIPTDGGQAEMWLTNEAQAWAQRSHRDDEGNE